MLKLLGILAAIVVGCLLLKGIFSGIGSALGVIPEWLWLILTPLIIFLFVNKGEKK